MQSVPLSKSTKFDFCHFQQNGNSESTVKMGKRTFLKPRPNARVFKNSCPRIERRNFGAVKTGGFRVLGFCQKGQKSSLVDRFINNVVVSLAFGVRQRKLLRSAATHALANSASLVE
jgi:hypothetical protein